MTDKNMGWQCPNCLVVYPPSVEKCECSVLPKEYSGNSSFVNTSTAYICPSFTTNSPNGLCSKCGQAEWKHYNLTTT